MTKIDISENLKTNTKVLLDELELSNVMALPKLTAVSVNIGLGRNKGNKEMIAYLMGSLEKITGQKPIMTKAKKAIAGFKIRTGDEVGMRVTLRGSRMNDFINRLINISLPRIRDFKGFDVNSFDNNGCMTIGFKDQVAFVELGHEGLDRPFGLAVTVVVKNSNPQKSAIFLKKLGFPMKIDEVKS